MDEATAAAVNSAVQSAIGAISGGVATAQGGVASLQAHAGQVSGLSDAGSTGTGSSRFRKCTRVHRLQLLERQLLSSRKDSAQIESGQAASGQSECTGYKPHALTQTAIRVLADRHLIMVLQGMIDNGATADSRSRRCS